MSARNAPSAETVERLSGRLDNLSCQNDVSRTADRGFQRVMQRIVKAKRSQWDRRGD